MRPRSTGVAGTVRSGRHDTPGPDTPREGSPGAGHGYVVLMRTIIIIVVVVLVVLFLLNFLRGRR